MATITKGKTFTSGETVTPTKLNDLVDNATITGIVNADIDANAAIAASKLALTGAITDTQLATGAVTGAAGGGKIAASAITAQTVIADPLADTDEFLVHDASASALRRVAWAALQPAGTVLQTVQSVNSTYSAITAQIPFDDTIPQNTEGTEIITATITPSSASNKVLVRVNIFGDATGFHPIFAVFRGTDAGAILSTSYYSSMHNATMELLDSPNSSSAITYKVRVGPSTTYGGTYHLNGWYNTAARIFGGSQKSTLTLQEIKG